MKPQLSKKTLKIIAASGIGAAVSVLVGAANASRQAASVEETQEGVPFVKGQLLVKTRSKAALEKFIETNQYEFGLLADREALHEAVDGTWFKVEFHPEADMKKAIEEALAVDGVESAEPNYIYTHTLGSKWPWPKPKPSPTPNPGGGGPDYKTPPELPNPPQTDPDMGKLYGMQKIGVEAAWQITTGSKKVVVADIDTGIDYNHVDLMNNLWRNPGEVQGDNLDNDKNGFVDDMVGYDFRDKDARPYDDNKHGSHTSGTIAATGGNGVGVSGVAKVASIMTCRFLGGAQGSGTAEDAIKCIDYTTKMGAKISSNSWGGGGYSKAMFDSIKRANDAGVLFVAAAGNSSTNNDTRPQYPAGYDLPNVIAVAATDANDAMAGFSNYGAKTVHLGAPGVKIVSTVINNEYAAFSGTSMAAPHVSGAAVLLKAAYPDLSVTDLKNLLLNSVDKVASLEGKTITGGRLNIAKAFDLAQQQFGAPVQE